MTPTELQRARRAAKATQEAFARRLGVHTRTLSRWETGAVPVPRWVWLVLTMAALRAKRPRGDPDRAHAESA
jgi:transcriptional regulator with XRE-family HTH domain